VFDIDNRKLNVDQAADIEPMSLLQLADGVNLEEITAKTEASFVNALRQSSASPLSRTQDVREGRGRVCVSIHTCKSRTKSRAQGSARAFILPNRLTGKLAGIIRAERAPMSSSPTWVW
jgi:hypothetical protein